MSEPRFLSLDSDQYRLVSRPFFHTLVRLVKYEESQEDRRSLYLQDPEWFFLYTPRHQEGVRSFLDNCYKYLDVLNKRPDISPIDFHSETGVLSRVVTYYIQEVKCVDKLLVFMSKYREYMLGNRKQFPLNVSDKKDLYRRLKRLSKNAYGLRLIEANKAQESLGTQDGTLFKLSVFDLVEQVLTATNTEDIVKYIDRVRTRL